MFSSSELIPLHMAPLQFIPNLTSARDSISPIFLR